MKTQITKVITRSLAIALFGLCLTTPIFAETPQSHQNSSIYQRVLAIYNAVYERWAFGAITLPTDPNGNAVVFPNVVLMPVPNTPGDGTPGHLDVTFFKGQGFVLPLWVLLGTHYTDGTPPDPFVPVSVFRTLNLTFKIDGRTVINQGNLMNFYTGFVFSPWIPVDFPPVDAIIFFQGISILHGPLSVGTHTLKLDAVNTQPAFGGFFEYHNTWTVTVHHR